jgi:transposase-like protein/DNA-directed RNA polymerase subunit RPC12/RpoP
MEDYPKNIIEFEQRFKTDTDCWNYLQQIRWPSGVSCPKCSCKEVWFSKRGLYTCKSCGFQISLTAGTIFQDTHKPLKLWFHAMWHITSQKYGANALGLMRVLGIGSYNTAWEWLHKLRRAMVRPGREKLTGNVEVDETYVGGDKIGKRGRGADGKALVMVAVEFTDTIKNKIGRIRLSQVTNASSECIEEFISQNIECGSTIHTDAWNGYNNIANIGYKHSKTKSTASVGEDPLSHCHLISSLFKRWLLGTYQGAVKPKHLDYYLDEYTFRFNRRKSGSRGKLFYRLCEQAVVTLPITRKGIEHREPDPLPF